MKQKNVVFVVTTFLLMGCRDVRDTELSKLTDKQRASLDKKLNGQEERLLIGYMMRQGMSPTFGGMGAPDGITVRQAINEQRNFLQKEEQAKAEEAKQWIDAGGKSKQWEFAQLLSVSLVDKWTHDEDFGEKYVAMEMAFENKTDKDIEGVKGTVKITNILGNPIKNISFSFDRGIAAKSTVKYIHYIHINQLSDNDLKLWNTDFDKLKTSFEMATIIYRDGSKVEVPESSQ
jgi:hypothetical protein